MAGIMPATFLTDKAVNRKMRDHVPSAATGITTSNPNPAGGGVPLTQAPVAKTDEAKSDDGDMDDSNEIVMSPEELGKAMKAKSASFDLATKEGRAAYRAKLAEKGLVFSDMVGKAHPKGGFTTQLDVKPSGDLAKVETVEEQHKAMMDIALATPKVKKLISPTEAKRAKAMFANGFTRAEVASALGVSLSTLDLAVTGSEQ
jgi:hypothetical protein